MEYLSLWAPATPTGMLKKRCLPHVFHQAGVLPGNYFSTCVRIGFFNHLVASRSFRVMPVEIEPLGVFQKCLALLDVS